MNRKHKIMIATCLVLSACGEAEDTPTSCPEKEKRQYAPMTNEQIIAETKMCENAGLQAEGLNVPLYGAHIVVIQCNPKN